MATNKKQSFFGGAAVLAFGIALVKVIGALFAIPLFNILGEGGAADFNNAYNIYAALLTVSTAGLPVALSKMVSEANALGRERQARRVFRVSFAAFLTLGVLSFAIMWWGSGFCAGLLHNPNAAYGIRVLAPAVVCVGCLSAFRGYAQGNFRMTPTAVSQIIEALCKLFVGLALAYYLLRVAGQSASIAAAGAIAGVTSGTILALCYMALNYLRHRTKPTTS
ncbi:MAG: oligosaccharide flippase family protein, partial [Oscillospiraceae bacterium]|nr:oligosaccharide flippase family protein [Oscillospiraceae bacterium]